MKHIPCKLCKACGKYSSLNVTACVCGADLTRIPGTLVEYNRIPLDRFGTIDPKLPCYVQKCSACGTPNFTADPDKRVPVCYNCNKSRIKSVLPVLFEEEEKAEPPKETPAAFAPILSGKAAPADEEDEDDDEDEQAGGSLYEALRKNIRPAAGAAPAAPAAPVHNDEDEDEDDEDDEIPAGGWGPLLEKKGVSAGASAAKEAPPRQDAATARSAAGNGVSTLTLTAIRYGAMTLTLRADSKELPYLLGRSAGCAEFLRQDLRVGNEHCWVDYRSGSWLVQEKRAINGTAVNRRFLPEGGKQILMDGDELVLGHHPDSMAFRVSIK